MLALDYVRTFYDYYSSNALKNDLVFKLKLSINNFNPVRCRSLSSAIVFFDILLTFCFNLSRLVKVSRFFEAWILEYD